MTTTGVAPQTSSAPPRVEPASADLVALATALADEFRGGYLTARYVNPAAIRT